MRRWLRLLLIFVASVLPVRSRSADANLNILLPGNIDRLRLDFNASRSKVRLVLMLSPTGSCLRGALEMQTRPGLFTTERGTSFQPPPACVWSL